MYIKILEREFFTLLDNSVNRTAELCGIKPYVTWNITIYRVNQALNRMDLSGVGLFYINETSSMKSYSYVIVICDQNRQIIFVCERESLDTVNRLVVWLEIFFN